MEQTQLQTLIAERKREVKSLGGRIKLAMAAKGIHRPADLANRMKRRRQTVQKWIDDRVSYVEPQDLFELADVLDVNARWLLTGEGTPSRPITLDLEKSRVLQIYQALPKEVREAWVRSGEATLKAIGEPSPANPYKV